MSLVLRKYEHYGKVCDLVIHNCVFVVDKYCALRVPPVAAYAPVVHRLVRTTGRCCWVIGHYLFPPYFLSPTGPCCIGCCTGVSAASMQLLRLPTATLDALACPRLPSAACTSTPSPRSYGSCCKSMFKTITPLPVTIHLATFPDVASSYCDSNSA